MGTLYLVRHGQASFGADNYDMLSDLGQRQAMRLGQYLRERGVNFEASITGTLERQRQTHAGICQGLGQNLQALEQPALNEYDSHALIEAIRPGPLPKPDTPEKYREHFRLLREALKAWMAGHSTPKGMPSHAQFTAGVARVLDHVRAQHDGHVLLVSSGGPISTAVGLVLGTPAETTIDLNMRIRNTALSELVFTPKRHMLLTYNTLPHLQGQEHQDWITYA